MSAEILDGQFQLNTYTWLTNRRALLWNLTSKGVDQDQDQDQEISTPKSILIQRPRPKTKTMTRAKGPWTLTYGRIKFSGARAAFITSEIPTGG